MPKPRFKILARALEHPRASLAILVVAAVLALPSLGVGFFADDYVFIGALERRLPYNAPWWSLYRFVPDSAEQVRAAIEAGQFRWWTTETLRLHLVRPLTSALFTLDWRLFGHAAIGYHLHSIAWYLALVGAVSVLYRRLFSARTSALATYIFAVSGALATPVAWASARHLLVVALLVVLALIAHLRAAEDGWRPGCWLAPLLLILALAAGEAGLSGIAYMVAFAVAGPTTRPRERWPMQAAVPLAVGAVYLLGYKLLGGGARGNAAYIEPLSSPGAFVVAAAERLPILLGNATAGVPAELAGGFPHAPFILIGVAAALALISLARAVIPLLEGSDRVALRWLGLGALASLLVSLGGFPGARQLALPGLFFAPLFAALLCRGLLDRPRLGRPHRAILWSLLVVHVIAAPLAFVGNALSLMTMARKVEIVARSPAVAKPRVFIAVASDPMAATYALGVRLVEQPDANPCWSLLSGARATQRLTRRDAQTLVLEVEDGELLTGSFETLYRDPSLPLAVGDEATQCGARIRVAEVRDGRPTRVEVRLDVSFDDPSVALVTWKDGALRPLVLPVGSTAELSWSPGPMGFL